MVLESFSGRTLISLLRDKTSSKISVQSWKYLKVKRSSTIRLPIDFASLFAYSKPSLLTSKTKPEKNPHFQFTQGELK
jgi:hypothetical protein